MFIYICAHFMPRFGEEKYTHICRYIYISTYLHICIPTYVCIFFLCNIPRCCGDELTWDVCGDELTYVEMYVDMRWHGDGMTEMYVDMRWRRCMWRWEAIHLYISTYIYGHICRYIYISACIPNVCMYTCIWRCMYT